MSFVGYTTWIIPAAHREAANRVMNLVHNDSGDSFIAPLSPTGNAPATHYATGGFVDADEITLWANMPSSLPTPSGGWPWQGITEGQAIAAIAVLVREVRMDDPSKPDIASKCISAAKLVDVLQDVVIEP